MAHDLVTTGSDGTVVRLTGRVDGATVATCRELLHRAVDDGAGPLVVDLTGVVVVDATGVGMLLGTARRATRAGRSLVLRGTPPRVARLLHAIGLDRTLPTVS
jgi:anti-sigma B factor antagonist